MGNAKNEAQGKENFKAKKLKGRQVAQNLHGVISIPVAPFMIYLTSPLPKVAPIFCFLPEGDAALIRSRDAPYGL